MRLAFTCTVASVPSADSFDLDLFDNMLDLKRRKQYYINQRTRVEHNIAKIISNVNSSDEDDLEYEAKYCTDGNCHRFTRDVIDIDENTSQRITYCTLCEYTKK